MRKSILLIAAFLFLLLPARADNLPGFAISGSTMTYSTGDITVNSVLTHYNAGTLTSFAASMNACGQSYLNTVPATDACEYIYYSAATNSLAHSIVFGTALPYVLAMVTTNGSGVPLTWVPYSPPAAVVGLIESMSLTGIVDGYYAQPSSATPAFNRAHGAIQYMILTGNVTSSTLVGGTLGNWIYLSFVQAASGGPYTVVWPANFHWAGSTPVTMGSTASAATGAECYYAGAASGWWCLNSWTNVK